MNAGKALKWVTFVYEILFSLVLFGGLKLLGELDSSKLLFILGLVLALALHLVALVLLNMGGLPLTANIFGAVSAVLGIIPILGWILRLTTIFLLLVEVVVMHQPEDPAVQH